METIAKAFAGHAARTEDTPALRAIAEQAALKTLDELADECLADPAVRAAYEDLKGPGGGASTAPERIKQPMEG